MAPIQRGRTGKNSSGRAIAAIFLLLPVLLTAAPSPNKNDSLFAFFWARTSSDSLKKGFYGFAGIKNRGQSDTVFKDSSRFQMFDCPVWRTVNHNDPECDAFFIFKSGPPRSVRNCSGKFAQASCSWLTAVKVVPGGKDTTIRFCFPVLAPGQQYSQYDFFSDSLNDSTALQYQAIADTVFAGSFINIKKPGVVRTKLYAKNAVAVLVDPNNALRIRRVQISATAGSLIKSYLGFDITKYQADATCYGIDFLDTVITVKAVGVGSVVLSGPQPRLAGSAYALTWSLLGKDAIAGCSVFTSVDGGKSWSFTAATVTDTGITWVAPYLDSSHCMIKVSVSGKDGQTAQAFSPEFAVRIDKPVSTIDSVPVNFYSLHGSMLSRLVLRLSWSANEKQDTIAPVDSLAVRYSMKKFPDSMNDTSSLLLRNVRSTSDTCDTLVDLQAGQTYYFSLFVRNTLDRWSKATEQSMIRVVVLDSTSGQAVSINKNPQKVNDSLWIWSKDSLAVPYNDFIDEWAAPSLPGFIQTSRGFSFRQGNLPPDLQIAIKFTYRNIQPPYQPSDQQVYQYDIFTDKWRKLNTASVVDTASGTVSAFITNARLPFMTLIDTLKPVVSGFTNGQREFRAGEIIMDTVNVTDNVENVSVRLFAAPGDQELAPQDLYVTGLEIPQSFRVMVPPMEDGCSGLRAFVIADDGRNADTVNVSKNIVREAGANCDNTSAPASEWTPLFVTADPEKPSLASIMSLSSTGGTPFTYDKKNIRIIQWLPIPENSVDTNKWVEYDVLHAPLFDFSPGRLIWMKSRDNMNIAFGKATVKALTDTFSVPLQPATWTDFSLPYKFSVSMADVIGATFKGAAVDSMLDSLLIYGWVKSASGYRTEPVFLSGIADSGKGTDTLSGGAPFSAFNPFNKPMTMRIPPVSAAVSPNTGSHSFWKQSAAGAWSVRLGIISGNHEHACPVYCASLPSSHVPRWYPRSPSLLSLNAAVFDRASGRLFGHAATGDLSKGGALFEIMCENGSSESRRVKAFVERQSGLPADMKIRLFSTDGKASTSKRAKDSLDFSLSSRQNGIFVLAVGTDAYLENLSRILVSPLSLRVLPAGKSFRIVFSLPYNAISMYVALFDLKGRRIRAQSLDAPPVTGSVVFNGPISRGFYMVEIRATVFGSQQPLVARKRVVYVR